LAEHILTRAILSAIIPIVTLIVTTQPRVAVPRTVHRALAAQAAGVPYMSLKGRRFHGDLKPAVPHREGSRGAEQWSVSQVLAVRVTRIIEHKFGTPISAMAELMNTLWMAEEADLRRLFKEGRRFVMIVGAVPVGRMLFTEEEISRNEMIDSQALAKAGLPLPQGLDIAEQYNAVIAAMLLEDLE
jgi:hypothetical protein